jgi:hypothetical protein
MSRYIVSEKSYNILYFRTEGVAFIYEVIAYGWIPAATVSKVQSSGRIRAQPNADGEKDGSCAMLYFTTLSKYKS